MADTFHCSVVTPEEAILECEATFAAFPAHDGEIGILPQRSALLCRLGIGILRVKTAEETRRFFVDGGFAQMVDNKLTLLTEQAKAEDNIEREAALAALEEARALPTEGEGENLHAVRQTAIERAQAQLKLVPKDRY
ncbi:MAG: ATP synthase F1 subunit epsilon [Acidobacteriota bacterium]